MKTNYDKIKAIIDSWHIAQVYNKKDNKYQLYSSIDSDWDMRCSWWEKSIGNCYDSLWTIFYTKNHINSLENITISVYQRPVRYPKVWDKVQILESVKQSLRWDEWANEAKEMIWWPFEVKSVYIGGCDIYTKDKSGYYLFDYRHLAPRIEDKEQTDILIKDGKKYKVQILEEIE